MTSSPPGSKGANALVTGARQRIGRAIALALAGDGWTVGIHVREPGPDAGALLDEVAAAGGTAYVVAGDLRDDGACARMMASAADAAGPVTCLVNNASLFERDELATVSRESWDGHMETNLWAPVLLSQAMAAGLPPGAEGNIVNIVDQRAANVSPGFLSYSVSKSALWALTQNLALSLAPSIRVNAIGPGPTLPSPRQTEEQFARQAARVPLGHGATPEEIANGVRYILASPSMTGQMIALDGGQHLGWDHPGPGGNPVEE